MSLGTCAVKGSWGPCKKYEAQQGSSMANLWTWTSAASGYQPAPSRWRSFQWWRNLPNPIPSVNRFLWGVGKVACWIGKIGEQISDPQRSTELANCKYGSIRPRQWSAKISRAGNSKHGYYSSQASTWQSRPLQPPRSHPTDHKEHRTHWIEINLALITFSHIKW